MASLLQSVALSLLLALAHSCSVTFPALYTGFSSSGSAFNDVYKLTAVGTQGDFQVQLIRGSGDSWTTATGVFSPNFSLVNISFSNGVKSHGVVTSCSRITWDGDHSYWDPLPPAPPNPPQCAAITSPAPCGQISDSYERCAQKGCCYDPSAAYPCYYPGGNAVPITHVHVLQASHMDVGFAYTIKDVLILWWYTHFPRATTLGLAIASNASSTVQLRFTAQMWIIDMFFHCPPNVPGLRCPTPTEQAALTNAIQQGWITWHAFPFNSEIEQHTADAFAAGISMAHALDDKFGYPHKATLSQRDVPGTTRASLPILAAGGVTSVSIGVNGASTPPFVPRAFVWKDEESGISMPIFIHPYGYGDISLEDAVVIPGLSHAMVFAWRGDNAGPPENVAEIEGNFATIRKEFPGAAVFASTFDNFTSHLVGNASLLGALPVIASEIGDTWLHGAASEPVRGAFFKRASTLLSQCLQQQPGAGGCVAGDPVLANFTFFLLKCGEHTWGKDIKGFLHDTTHWSNEALQQQLAAGAPNFLDVVASWQEQRDWCATYAIGALTTAAHPLGPLVQAAYDDLFPSGSGGGGSQPNPASDGFTPFPPGKVYSGSAAWALAFDPGSGALSHLEDKGPGGRVWADSATQGTSLLTPSYTTLSGLDYDVFTGPEPNGYYPLAGDSPDWYKKDFGKPNVSSANPIHSVTPSTLAGVWLKENATHAHFLVHSTFPAPLHTQYGAPSDMWVELEVPLGGGGGGGGGVGGGGATTTIQGSLSMYGKTPTRLPEGLYLRVNVSAPGGWRVGKLNSTLVDPFDVVPGGNHHQHGFGAAGVRALGGGGGGGGGSAGAAFVVTSLDFSQAQFGAPIPLPAPVWANATHASEGLSFLLIDNTWGTNYPAWVPWREGEENMRWRFQLNALS